MCGVCVCVRVCVGGVCVCVWSVCGWSMCVGGVCVCGVCVGTHNSVTSSRTISDSQCIKDYTMK